MEVKISIKIFETKLTFWGLSACEWHIRLSYEKDSEIPKKSLRKSVRAGNDNDDDNNNDNNNNNNYNNYNNNHNNNNNNHNNHNNNYLVVFQKGFVFSERGIKASLCVFIFF